MSRIVGIDLGTTNSVIAVLESGEPRVITNQEGARVTPSVVAFTQGSETLVGEVARRQAIMNPGSTVFSVKRFMGRRFDEIDVKREQVPYDLVEGDNGDVAIRVRDRTLSPPEISAKVLQKLKQAAEDYLGEEVREAVITVPAYFNDAQRKATRDAGRIAGLEVKRIVNEPTAAALGYGLGQQKDELIAVYDFGGGTFDISLLEFGGDVLEVLSTNGDTRLGGDDVDACIVGYLLEQFQQESGVDVSEDRMVLQRLREAAEKAKIELSSILETDINLPFLTADATGPKHLHLKITRAKLEYMIDELVERTLGPCRKALEDAGKIPGDVEQVLLVGGSTRIPMVQRKVTEFFGREPHRGVNPDEVVALGAAIQGGILTGDVKDLLLLDVTPLSLGLETQGGVMTTLIPRNTTIPTSRHRRFSTVVDNQSSVAIHVLQGERDFATDNRSLGRFELTGIPPAPRAQPQIEVHFNIDANGILEVSAVEKRTEKKASVVIQGAGGLSDDDIRRAVKDAEEAEVEDRARRERVELRNRLTGRLMEIARVRREEPEDFLNEEETQTLEAALNTAREAEGDGEDIDAERLRAEIEGLGEQLRRLQERRMDRLRAKQSGDAGESGDADDAPSEDAHASAEDDTSEAEDDTSEAEAAEEETDSK